MTEQADLVVLGDGVAGFAAAIAAARSGLDTLLVAGRSISRSGIPETLAPNGIQLVSELGIDHTLANEVFYKIANRLSRWGIGTARDIPSIAMPTGSAMLLDKTQLVELLRNQAHTAGVRLIKHRRITGASDEMTNIVLQSNNAGAYGNIVARFALDATGRTAQLARQFGARRRKFDRLVSFWIDGPAPPETQCSIATVTVRDGWMFYVGKPKGGATLAFFTGGLAIQKKPSATDILARLPYAPELVRMIRDINKWQRSLVVTRNAATTILTHAGGSHWLACGDSLQTVDPLTSNGISTALDQGMKAARAIAAALHGNRSGIKDYRARAAYEFEKYIHQRRVYYGQVA